MAGVDGTCTSWYCGSSVAKLVDDWQKALEKIGLDKLANVQVIDQAPAMADAAKVRTRRNFSPRKTKSWPASLKKLGVWTALKLTRRLPPTIRRRRRIQIYSWQTSVS
jgi:hypothetical protein